MLKPSMLKTMSVLAACTAALALAAPAQAGLKRAFDHEITNLCPVKKSSYPDGRERYSSTDLALTTVSARYDAKELLTFKEIKAGKKPPVVTKAMLEQRAAKALAEFDKVLDECKAEHDWTAEERDFIREYYVATSGQSRSTFALHSPPASELYNQYAHHMNQTDFQALADGKFPGSAVQKAVIADLKASDWYKRTRKYLSLDDPYFQGLITDAYYNHLVAEVMRGRFGESAKKRFPE